RRLPRYDLLSAGGAGGNAAGPWSNLVLGRAVEARPAARRVSERNRQRFALMEGCLAFIGGPRIPVARTLLGGAATACNRNREVGGSRKEVVRCWAQPTSTR